MLVLRRFCDGALIETDRCRIPGPTTGVDLWWSAKRNNHGGNVQVITVGDGWPIWTSEVRPGHVMSGTPRWIDNSVKAGLVSGRNGYGRADHPDVMSRAGGARRRRDCPCRRGVAVEARPATGVR